MTGEQLNKALELQAKIARANGYASRLITVINGLEVPKTVSETATIQYLYRLDPDTHPNEYRDELIDLRDELIKEVTNIIEKHAAKYTAAFAAL